MLNLINDAVTKNVTQALDKLIQNQPVGGRTAQGWIKCFQDHLDKIAGLNFQSTALDNAVKTSNNWFSSMQNDARKSIFANQKTNTLSKMSQNNLKKEMTSAQYDLLTFREAITGQKQEIAIQYNDKLKGGTIVTKYVQMPLTELFNKYSSLLKIVQIQKNGQFKLDLDAQKLKTKGNQKTGAFAAMVHERKDKVYNFVEKLANAMTSTADKIASGDPNGLALKDWAVYEIYVATKDLIENEAPEYNYKSTPPGVYSTFLSIIDKWHKDYDTGLQGGDAGSLIQAKSIVNGNANYVTGQNLLVAQLYQAIKGLNELLAGEKSSTYRLTNLMFNGEDAMTLRHHARDYLLSQLKTIPGYWAQLP